MENKTISYLNSRAWYRFLKVAFIFMLLAVILIANGINISEGIGRIDKNKTLIYCNGGDKRVLTARQAGVYFSNYEFIKGFDYKKYFEGYNEYDIKDILEACYDYNNLDSDIYLIQRIYEIRGSKDNPKKYDDDYLKEQIKIMTTGYKSKDQKISYLDYSIHLFDIKPIYSYKEFIMYFLIINISILLIFEVLRRVFYYIVLGAIKPKK